MRLLQVKFRFFKIFFLEQDDAQLQMGLKIPHIFIDTRAHMLFQRGVVIELGKNRTGILSNTMAMTFSFIGDVFGVNIDIDFFDAAIDPILESDIELSQR